MKYFWLIRNNSDDLIIFFAGWGMDEKPFLDYSSSSDVVIVYDYNDINDFEYSIIKNYRNISVLAWSMGVWAANIVFSRSDIMPQKSIAISGTLKPIDDKYGIPLKIYDFTIRGFERYGSAGFDKSMCVTDEVLEIFTEKKPARDEKGKLNELRNIRNYDNGLRIDSNIFDFAIISDNDKIIPTDSQVEFWMDSGVEFVKIEAPHYPFYLWDSFDDILRIQVEG